ncbi:16S rRNA (adenine(1518)-N(6)/adenine(1519)-N(6))-dimethyltransferase RsmA [Seongchinamella sediminis]|uniref:Ribosomal RNA small subunit methyltransferase A n=1 Tax=Seongchinamella sediminis TaxID=2283635 RepID=A0A3L7DWL9_9GAMM|nr:16S rRNA (adenine(1518)-N(6)/adenine(1519)-N(6))-dimethyltransferase RsmA [Seongchinamella sediminis]RLQ21175.1 16S rRNA (adenine(1518)-N(6)/adenine(1519)-N(6))-dimethyltransferase RsmA [Seongchinamella sediminis]
MAKRPGTHIPRKRFGQNFLTDHSVIGRIADAIGAEEQDHLVEIGPGQGALTEILAPTGCRLDVIELDRDLVAGLLAAFSIYPGFKLHSADALKFDFAALATDGKPLRVVGNLPYNISTPLIFKLLENAALIEDMHFMLQLEVVERLAAEPGSKAWGRLGIMAQYHCAVEHLFDVAPSAFNPPPKVQSAIVRLTPRKELPWAQCQEGQLRRVVQAAFAQRRKTLRNNLKGFIEGEALESLGIDPGCRAETLQLSQFIEIANAINE